MGRFFCPLRRQNHRSESERALNQVAPKPESRIPAVVVALAAGFNQEDLAPIKRTAEPEHMYSKEWYGLLGNLIDISS